MSSIQWLSSDFDVDRSRSDRHPSKDRLRFEGALGVSTQSAPLATAEIAPTAPVPPSEPSLSADVRSIMEQVAVRVSEGGSELTLQWETPELGSLQIEVRREGDRVEVTIRTDDASAAQLLESHQAVLGELLADEGLQLARIAAISAGPRRTDIDSDRNDSESEITSLLGVIRRASSS